jgi:LysM repeat protein
MGQLEKYGLYVLCLVIFLILGVALWGDPAAAADRQSPLPMREAKVTIDQKAPAYDLNEFQALVGNAPRTEPKPVDDSRREEPKPTPVIESGDAPAPKVEDKPTPIPENARESYVVVKGDTLSSIASKKAGSVRFVKLLEEINPGLSAARLQIGQKIQLPMASEIANAGGKPSVGKKAEEPSGSGALRTHEIASGDTFEDLAARLLGDAKRQNEIKKLNPTLDPTKLRIGQKILLPAK